MRHRIADRHTPDRDNPDRDSPHRDSPDRERADRDMTDTERDPPDAPRPYRARLPGFVSDADLGLGDAIARVSRTFGVSPCDRCKRRAAVLNRWLVFRGRAR